MTATDFLGQELGAGDIIVYPVARGSRADIIRAEIVELVPGRDRWGRECVKARTRTLADSAVPGYRPARSAGRGLLTNLARCVRVDKRSPVCIDLAQDHPR